MATTAKVSVEQVREALKDVFDPEIPVNVVDLGLVYEMDVSDSNEVFVKMTLTAPGCGMGPLHRPAGRMGSRRNRGR